MEQLVEIDVDAPAARVWAVLHDVERWPEWTASVRSVTLLDGALRTGARARVDQPRIPSTVWTVTALTEGHDFTWEATGPGSRTTARHLVEPTGPRSCRVVLSIVQAGPVGSVVGRAYRRLTERYLALESAGIKTRAESPPAG